MRCVQYIIGGDLSADQTDHHRLCTVHIYIPV